MHFVFQVSNRNINDRVLKFTVYDVDRHKKHQVIGHALYPLKDHDCEANERLVVWRDLEREVAEVSYFYYMHFNFEFMGSISDSVKRGRTLLQKRWNKPYKLILWIIKLFKKRAKKDCLFHYWRKTVLWFVFPCIYIDFCVATISEMLLLSIDNTCCWLWTDEGKKCSLMA